MNQLIARHKIAEFHAERSASRARRSADVVVIDKISTDSRTMQAAAILFVALRGENFDGHNFVEARGKSWRSRCDRRFQLARKRAREFRARSREGHLAGLPRARRQLPQDRSR